MTEKIRAAKKTFQKAHEKTPACGEYINAKKGINKR
jgi:hypothetical protein